MTVSKPVSIGKTSGHYDNAFKINMGGSQSGTMGHILARYEYGRSWGQRPWPQLKGQCWLASSSSRPLCKAPPQSAGRSGFTTSLPPCDPVLDPSDLADLWGHGGGQRLWQRTSLDEVSGDELSGDEVPVRGALNPGKSHWVPSSSCASSTANSPFTRLFVWDVIALAGKRTKLKGRECGLLEQALPCYGCRRSNACWVGVSSLSLHGDGLGAGDVY